MSDPEDKWMLPVFNTRDIENLQLGKEAEDLVTLISKRFRESLKAFIGQDVTAQTEVEIKTIVEKTLQGLKAAGICLPATIEECTEEILKLAEQNLMEETEPPTPFTRVPLTGFTLCKLPPSKEEFVSETKVEFDFEAYNGTK